MRYLVSIILLQLVSIPQAVTAKDAVFAQAKCTIVYSLKRSADKYFNDEISQLDTQIKKQKIQFIDLNNWRKVAPHVEISGRFRNQLRHRYDLPKNMNQAIILDSKGQELIRYSGSVTLVNGLIACN
ncbi:MAG: hypothetical protein ABJK37_17455 [Paraglaciecola sp.]|uniref:hypothetical protein n=1 Tax=Paraglaciecola sp. TaxID=1920173 RepID=UPI0032970FAD